MSPYSGGKSSIRRLSRFTIAVIAFAGIAYPAAAETIQIAALGASNTYGLAVGPAAAWPAKLEAMLKAKGYDVSMHVIPVSVGDASMVLAHVDSVPAGTKVVVYDVGGGNSADRGITPAALRPQIEAKIRARGANPVWAAYNQIIGPEKGNPAWIQGDAHHHFTAASHTRVATALLPKVIAAIGQK